MGHTLRGEFEQHTGLVKLFTSGKRPPLKTAEEIHAIANKTKFLEERVTRRESDNGSIEFAPRAFGETNPIRQALAEGLVVAKFTTKREPPLFRQLEPGTYALMLDFVPGAENGSHEGRWVGRIVGYARPAPRFVECFVTGIEVKEMLAFGEPGQPEPPGEPEVRIHGLGSGLDAGSRTVFAEGSGWVEYQVDWKEFGAGCWKTTICIPGT